MNDVAVKERDEVLRHGDEAWALFAALLEQWPDEPLSEDGWTGKDVYAHFARWQQQSIDALHTILAGRAPPPPEADEDTLNNRWHDEDRSLSAEEARARCIATRTELRALIAGLDGEQWTRFGRLFEDITGPHYEHHLAACGDRTGAG